MRKWSPEPFAVELPATGHTAADGPGFEPLPAAGDGPGRARLFRSRTGAHDAETILATLTPEERAQVYAAVERDLAAAFAAREREAAAAADARLDAARAEMADRIDRWSAALRQALAVELRQTGAACARLSVEIAGKIVRSTVRVEPEVVARAVETALFKLAESRPLTVRAHPDEAEWLAGQERLRERLNIGRIEADRRIESGGCVIRCEGQEWDATLARQLETIAEIVEEMVAGDAGQPLDGFGPEPETDPAGAAPPPVNPVEAADDPALD